jgi:hypothetical protein
LYYQINQVCDVERRTHEGLTVFCWSSIVMLWMHIVVPSDSILISAKCGMISVLYMNLATTKSKMLSMPINVLLNSILPTPTSNNDWNFCANLNPTLHNRMSRVFPVVIHLY